jgi:hypothetical protein
VCDHRNQARCGGPEDKCLSVTRREFFPREGLPTYRFDWRGNDNTRLQKMFKDFYRLAEFPTIKRKELWVTDDTYVLKYLRSGSSVRSATHKHRDVWESFQNKYPVIEKVSEYYRLHSCRVNLRVYDQD